MVKFLIIILLNFTLLISEELSVDNQFTDNKTIELSIGVDYINSYSNNLNSSDTILETVNGDYVKVPMNYQSNSSTDYINSNLSINYGFSDRLSIYSYLSSYYLYSRDIDDANSNTIQTKDFDTLNIGINYILKKETSSPAYFIRISSTIIDKVYFDNKTKNKHFTNFNFSIGSYFTSDPITFMFQSTLMHSRELKYKNTKQKDGNIILFSPTLYFSINPYITMSFDIEYQYISKNRENGKYISKERSELKRGIGIIYEIDKKKSLSIDYSSTSNVTSSQNVSVVFTYKL
jgi:hypothetical protein